MKILVAEDHQPLQATIKYLMEDWGYQADVVSNGQEAVRKAGENQYDLCLMDLNMPIMNGFEAAKIIRRKLKFVPILALTSNARSEMRQCWEAGMDDFMEKPFDCQALNEKIINLTVKAVTIQKNRDRIRRKKEMPMNADHLKELRELAKKGLVKLVLRGKGDEFIVHQNVQNKISHDFIAEGRELSVFLDRAEDKPGVCHLYKANLYANMRYLLPEELEQLVSEEDEGLKNCNTAAVRRKEE